MGKTTRISVGKLLEGDIEQMQQAIRELAYQRYIERGSQPGSALEDWLNAESALVLDAPVKVLEQDNATVAEMEVAGIEPKNLSVKADGQRILVLGPLTEPLQLFSVIGVANEIDPDTVSAELSDGLLRIIATRTDQKESALGQTA